MKKLYFILMLAIISCNKEDANDCFQTSGNMITQEVTVADFSKIEVDEGVTLVLKEAPTHQVIIETGENLLNEVGVQVTGETLVLKDHNECNFFREYGATTIYVSAPNISEIRSRSQYEVRSDGVLTYPELKIISENFYDDNVASGEFKLNIENDKVEVLFNNLSNLYITGSTDIFYINFPGGNSRVEATNFIAEEISIFTRGSNDIIVHPVQKISGDIYGTGNVIAVNEPTIVEVTAHYTGSLIFN